MKCACRGSDYGTSGYCYSSAAPLTVGVGVARLGGGLPLLRRAELLRHQLR